MPRIGILQQSQTSEGSKLDYANFIFRLWKFGQPTPDDTPVALTPPPSIVFFSFEHVVHCIEINIMGDNTCNDQCATLTLDRSTQSSNPGTGRVHILRHWTCWSSIYSRPHLLCNVTRPILVLSACLTSTWIVCSSGIKTTRRRH